MSNEFLKSMTFASAAGRGRGGLEGGGGGGGGFGPSSSSCDCDECFPGSESGLPVAIREALQRRKRQRLETGPIKRTQQRTFICRKYCEIGNKEETTKSSSSTVGGGGGGGGTISLYDVTMPLNAEPLIEFGTSHRIIHIKRLPSSSIIESIGEGIIGSQDEETTRQRLTDWTEGTVVLVPSTDGKAAGWIHDIACKEKIDKKDSKKLSSTRTESQVDSTETGRDEDSSQPRQYTEDRKTDSADVGGIKSTANSRDSSGAYATLHVCKIPESLIILDDDDDDDDGSTPRINIESSNEDDSTEDWSVTMMKYCRKGLIELKNKKIETPKISDQDNARAAVTTAATTSSSSASKAKQNSYYQFEDEVTTNILKSAFDLAKTD